MEDKDLIQIMVNGLPGSMATKVAEHILSANKKEYPFKIYPVSITGPEITSKTVIVSGLHLIHLHPSNEREGAVETLKKRKDKFRGFIIVDYTHPSAVNENAKLYCSLNIPFVMGTTGGNRDDLISTVEQSTNCAVIAPNMAKQIVAFQAMMQFAADNFPGAFKGYTLEIVESHQKGKADTSGTAKAMVEYFNKLGIPFTKKQIVMIRDSGEQLKMGIPEDALSGHGWHSYTLRSSDGTILFQFTHNVNGRDVYAQGTMDAINFLARNIKSGKVYSMIDVLKGA